MNCKTAFIFFLVLSYFLLTGCSPKTTQIQIDDNEASLFKQPVKITGIWKDTDTTFTKYTCPDKIFPLAYRLLDVDTAVVRKQLILQGSQSGVISTDTFLIEIPLPDGSRELFSISQVQVMAPELAAKYPYLKTYAGSSTVYAADQIRLEANPEGIRVMVLSTRGTVLLDPYCKDDKLHMISYFKKNLPEGLKEEFERK